MAFTSDEKIRILFYLGYSVFEDGGPAWRGINSLDAREATGGFLIRDVMDKIDNIRRQLDETIPLAKAVQDGSLQLRAHYTLDHLRRLGRMYVSQLAAFVAIDADHDIFGTNPRDANSFYAGPT